MRTPKEICEKYMQVGIGKTKTKPSKVFLLAILAGMFIAFAGVASTIANSVTNRLCGALIFCGGLAMVLVAGSELFTGNNLLILPLLDKKIKLSDMLKNLAIVYFGNLFGAILVAFLAVYSGALDSVSENVIAVASSKCSLPFVSAFFKGILCNFLVCIAVWMAFSSDKSSDKIIAVIFPITIFVLCGFEHSVANMYFIPAGFLMSIKSGLKSENISIVNFFIKNLLPVTFGNMVGGSGIVGTMYYFIFAEK